MNEYLYLRCEGRRVKKEMEMYVYKIEGKLRWFCVRKLKRRWFVVLYYRKFKGYKEEEINLLDLLIEMLLVIFKISVLIEWKEYLLYCKEFWDE